jgi:hypothetical protein
VQRVLSARSEAHARAATVFAGYLKLTPVLVMVPYISLSLPISPYLSLSLPISPYISLYLPISPYISLYLTSSS